ncbi:NAD(P)/FAD-dependent oxidoreductase [Curtobacterium sp. MCBD17_030]|uniref:flavin-containing monooxygenase n=1 Tax=Curtobacterium sp. MCBD17_030 TaxID=2175649 RepID=UPI0015E8B2EE|nr:NAD(P)/FAD-dependent oxidoreductase [Curtobacterium sp. MCBD17_030]
MTTGDCMSIEDCTSRHDVDVCVVGAGPAGLATAAALRRTGRRVVLLERAATLTPRWRTHRPGLRLHTTRSRSCLPGMPIDPTGGRYVSSADMVAYWQHSARGLGVTVRTGVLVTRIEPVPVLGDSPRPLIGGSDGRPRWIAHVRGGACLRARSVVVATGYNAVPVVPDWPGVDTFPGPVAHAADLGSLDQLVGRRVLVVGGGNAGAEAAVELLCVGAEQVWLSIRTPPHIVRQRVGPWSAQGVAIALDHLPTPVADALAGLQRRLTVPDLAAWGLPAPQQGLYSRVRETHSVPVQDTGLVAGIQAGRIRPVPAVVRFDDHRVVLDDGSALRPDAVVAATGYRRGLDDLLTPAVRSTVDGVPRTGRGGYLAPGLSLVGFRVSAGGTLRGIAQEARAVARREAADAA